VVHYYHYHGRPSLPYRKANNTVRVGQAPPADSTTREHHASNDQPHNPVSGYERAADKPDDAVHYYHYHGMQSMPYRKANNTVHVGQAPPADSTTREYDASNAQPQNPISGYERAADTPDEAVHYYHYHGMQSMPYRNVASPCA
jgi:hypothetical protein